MKEHYYHCEVIMACMASRDTQRMKKSMEYFLKAHYIKAEILKEPNSQADEISCYYSVEIHYKNTSFLQVLRFSEALNSFCRFHGMIVYEHELE